MSYKPELQNSRAYRWAINTVAWVIVAAIVAAVVAAVVLFVKWVASL